MLAKCANSFCSRPFLHLNGGRLFRLETDPAFRPFSSKGTEYFWLCDACSPGLTLRFAPDGRVTVMDLEQALRDDPQGALVSVNRKNGLLLRSVAFCQSSDSRELKKEERNAA